MVLDGSDKGLAEGVLLIGMGNSSEVAHRRYEGTYKKQESRSLCNIQPLWYPAMALCPVDVVPMSEAEVLRKNLVSQKQQKLKGLDSKHM